jgi:hypothetical protein
MLATVSGLGAFEDAFKVRSLVSNGQMPKPRRSDAEIARESALAREIGEWNAAVDRRKAERKARKGIKP